MEKLLLKNIQSLYGIQEASTPLLKGREMDSLPNIDHAFISFENGVIDDFGPMNECPEEKGFDHVEDCKGQFVLPAWCDSHTHIVWAGSREGEFVDKINGLTYEEVAAKGGGILNSAKRLANATEEELIEAALKRLNEIQSTGTGAVEIKSGYGLSVKSELKILRVIQKLKELTPLTIKANFLGAHSFPNEYKDNHQGYIDLIINEMLPVIAKENLADFIDVFCERGYYSVEETAQILEAGIKLGLTPKIHANQFSLSGGVQLAVKMNALSVDHLEVVGDEEIEALKTGNTIPTVLPSCSFFLNIPYAPAKRMIDEGLPLCMATDFNPGTTPSGNIPFLISLACINYKLTPEQAINAVTLNGAAAMNLQHTHGSITRGKIGNVIITEEMPSLAYMPYAFGSNHVSKMVLNGEMVS